MQRDPLYTKIEEALDDLSDGDAFESAAVRLLSERYPNLVPYRGGSDRGFDGFAVSPEGDAIALICTIRKDVIGNVSKNLQEIKNYLQELDEPRPVVDRCVVATPQALSNRRRENLTKRAARLGFRLVNTHDRTAFTDLLYRHSSERKDLLGLPGYPPALSVFPPISNRPLHDTKLYGRLDDVKWLRGLSSDDDYILVGQPGSGKTYLLHRLAKTGRGLFVATDDEARLADAVRDLKPSRLVVDDAHIQPERLSRLRAVLRDIGSKASIAAVTWPSAEGRVRAELQVPDDRVHHLEPIPAACIEEIYRQRGLSAETGVPPQILRDLIHQASNLPGLAMTLAQLCLLGNWEDVLSGQSLRELTLRTLGRIAGGERLVPLLAVLSLGGSAGMPLDKVGEVLGMSPTDRWEAITSLASSGIVFERSEYSAPSKPIVGVRPSALRSSFIERVFFANPSVFDVTEFLKLTEDRRAALYQLADAASRCPKIDRSIIRRSLQELEFSEFDRMRPPDGDPWLTYASLGPEEARWVLEHYQGRPEYAAQVALEVAPRPALDQLLQLAETSDGPLHSQPFHPLRILDDWLRARDATIERRRLVLQAIERRGLADLVAFRSLCLLLDPSVLESETNALGTGVTIYGGARPVGDLERILGIWPEIHQQIQLTGFSDWHFFEERLGKWLMPKIMLLRDSPGLTAEQEATLQRGAAEIVRDLRETFEHDFFVQLGLHHLAREERGDGLREVDHDIALLLEPPGSYEDEVTKFDHVASSWLALGPKDGARRLLEAHRAIQKVKGDVSYAVQEVARRIADQTDEAVAWLDRLIDDPHLARFFARRTTDSEFLDRYERWLKASNLRRIILWRGLRLTDPPPEVLDLAAEDPSAVGLMVHRQEIAPEVLRLFLSGDSLQLRAEAAAGLWKATNDAIPEDLTESWEAAVITGALASHHQRSTFRDIFEARSELGARWLLREDAQQGSSWSFDREELASVVCRGLGLPERLQIVDRMQEEGVIARAAADLVQRDPQVFRAVLDRFGGAGSSLSLPIRRALSRPPDTDWLELASISLDAGIAPASIAESTYHEGFYLVRGTMEDAWRRFVDAFEALPPQQNPQLQEVVNSGLELATAELERSTENRRAREQAFT